jgi:hypothetical protein
VRPTIVVSTAAVAAAALSAGLLITVPAGADPGRSAERSAARAAAAVTIGQAGGTLTVCNGTVPAGLILGAAASGAPTYVAPSPGVVTSYTTVANNRPGQVRAMVLRAGATSDRQVVTAKSPKHTVVISATNTFPVRLPMLAGQRLGLGWTVSGMACAVAGTAGDVSVAAAPFDPDLTSDFVYSTTLAGIRPNISAVLEPDVDGDAFGDVSQDACPQSALSQVVCPAPDTILTKKPHKHRGSRRIKVKFTSTMAGSAFECSRDGHKFKPCRSPYKRHFGPGKHKLLIRAVSVVGVPDATPIKVKFTLR